MSVVIIAGFAVDVQRKRIKNLNLRVTQDCHVTLSVPMRATNAQIEEFIISKKDWIERSLVRFKDSSNKADQWYGDGGRICVLGKTYDVVELTGPRMMCQISDGIAYLTCPDDTPYSDRERYMKEWYRAILKDVLPGLFDKWESMTGLQYEGYQTKYMRTKWGTCNYRTKKIWMNVRLAEKPVECIEYVVLHELIHTRIPDHGQDFKAALDMYMPDWKERKKKLNYGIDHADPTKDN